MGITRVNFSASLDMKNNHEVLHNPRGFINDLTGVIGGDYGDLTDVTVEEIKPGEFVVDGTLVTNVELGKAFGAYNSPVDDALELIRRILQEFINDTWGVVDDIDVFFLDEFGKFLRRRQAQRIDEEKRVLEDAIRARQDQIPDWKKWLNKVKKALDFSELHNIWEQMKKIPAFACLYGDRDLRGLFTSTRRRSRMNIKAADNLEFDELVEEWLSKNNAYSIAENVNQFRDFVGVLGYNSLEEFLRDNPGAVESIMEWIINFGDRVPEWKEALEEVLLEE